MTSSMKKSINTLLILFFPLVLSCATTGQSPFYTEGNVIDRGNYSLIGPPGDGWLVGMKGGVTLFYKDTGGSGNDEIKIMAVGIDFDEKKGRYSSEEEVALKFINSYEEGLMKNAKESNCVTNDMKKGTTVISDKKLYFISSVATGCTVGAASRGKGLYIFFPADFSERHGCYIFVFSQFRDKGIPFEGIDLKLIAPVIGSLRIKEKIEVEPKDAKTYYQMGLTHVQKGDFDQAILYFNKSIEMDPKNSMAYSNRGSAYAVKGQYDRAISDWTKALEIDPKYAGAYYNRGNVFCRMGQYDKAISDLNKAIEIDPRHAGAYTERGIAYQEKGQNDQAISNYTKALEINPKFALAYFNRGRSYYFKKEYDKSWEDIKKAQDLGFKIPPEFLEDLRKASGRQH